MENKKKNKLFTKIILMVCIVSILITVIIVPCSADSLSDSAYNDEYSPIWYTAPLSVRALRYREPTGDYVYANCYNVTGIPYDQSRPIFEQEFKEDSLFYTNDFLEQSKYYPLVENRFTIREPPSDFQHVTRFLSPSNYYVRNELGNRYFDRYYAYDSLLLDEARNIANNTGLDSAYYMGVTYDYSIFYDDVIDVHILNGMDHLFPTNIAVEHYVTHDGFSQEQYDNFKRYIANIKFDIIINALGDYQSVDLDLILYPSHQSYYGLPAIVTSTIRGSGSAESYETNGTYYELAVNNASQYGGFLSITDSIDMSFIYNEIAHYVDEHGSMYIKNLSFELLPALVDATTYGVRTIDYMHLNGQYYNEGGYDTGMVKSLAFVYHDVYQYAGDAKTALRGEYDRWHIVEEQVFFDYSFNFVEWLGHTLGDFMHTEIIGPISVSTILYVALGCGFVLLVLKFFAGG